MSTTTLEKCGVTCADSATDHAESTDGVDRLARLLSERFPEEAASADMSTQRGVVDLAAELLKRLWRWEN